MARALAFSAIVAVTVSLKCGAFGAPTDPPPSAAAAYKQYFDQALKNPAYSAASADLRKMNIKSTKVFSACIGQFVKGTGCPTADYFFGCAFAEAHPSDPDSAAAEEVCGEYASGQYAVQRIKVYDGDGCGYIIDTITCAF